jgi:xylan 1,4-beta-xylosidase
VAGAPADVRIALAGLPATRSMRMTQYRVDRDHSNAHTAWQRMGSPAKPTSAQMAALKRAGQLAQMGVATSVPVANGQATLDVPLPRQSVALLELTW